MPPDPTSSFMQRAWQLAVRGQGRVEPNPMVGCVLVKGGSIVGEGWHREFGGPHAEVEAINAAGEAANGATMYVTLEPCCHQGKTPPCTAAVIDAGIAEVVIGEPDPFPAVDGGGVQQLRAAGIPVKVQGPEFRHLQINAPYRCLIQKGRPWVIAKWAMTLDGKIATREGHSQWISNQSARQVVHRLRGRVDAIVVGRGTAVADDPLLTARPPGPRTATRIVLTRDGKIPSDSQLVKTAREVPTMIVTERHAAVPVEPLKDAGCEVLQLDATDHATQLLELLDQLGRRRMTNLLLEGGGEVLGAAFDARVIDEAHVFLAAKLVGGAAAVAAMGGNGVAKMDLATELQSPCFETLGDNLYVHGQVRRDQD